MGTLPGDQDSFPSGCVFFNLYSTHRVEVMAQVFEVVQLGGTALLKKIVKLFFSNIILHTFLKCKPLKYV